MRSPIAAQHLFRAKLPDLDRYYHNVLTIETSGSKSATLLDRRRHRRANI